MTLLGFELVLPGIPQAEAKPLELPVEVRSADMTLVAQTFTSQWPSVDEGTYVVTARLPAGQSIVTIVEAKGTSVKARLELPAGEQPDGAWQERRHLFESARAQKATERQAAASIHMLGDFEESSRSLGYTMARRHFRYIVTPDDLLPMMASLPGAAPAPRPAGSLTLFVSRLLGGEAKALPSPAVLPSKNAHVAQLEVAAAAGPAFVQVRREGKPAVNIALPLSAQRGCTIVVHREPRSYWIEAHPDNEGANLLLGYRQNNLAQQQAAAAERLVYDKLEDPIGATIGAYSLLRFGELERLHTWTGNLMKFFPWLPDGAAVRGEHLARTAAHSEAIAAFLEVVKRGLPLFSEGLRFTFDRLQLYADADTAPEQARACREAAAKLKPHLRLVNFDQTLTTFESPEPDVLEPSVDLAKLFAD